MDAVSKPKVVCQTVMKMPQQRVWEAITKPEFTSRYDHGCILETDLAACSPTCHLPNGSPIVEGEVVASEPPNRLTHTCHSLWPMNQDAATQVTRDLESMSEVRDEGLCGAWGLRR